MAAAWVERMAFGREYRVAVWMLCADLLESGYEIERVLPVVADVNRRAGRAAVAKVVEGLVPALEAGRLREAVERVTPAAEAMVFEGFGRADAAAVFRSAARIATVRERVANSLRANLAGPVFPGHGDRRTRLWRGSGIRAGARATGAARAVAGGGAARRTGRRWPSPSTWSGSGAGVVVLASALAWLARNWTGAGRRMADNVVPFSLVRFVVGLSFVLSIVEAMRAGLDMDRRLFEDLAKGGTRYSRHRILAIAREMERGEQLGRAMEGAHHGFPAPELIPVVMALDGMDEWADRLGRFVDRWVERSERVVRERAMVMNRVLTLVVVLIAGSAMWLLFGVLQDLIGQAV